MIYTMATSLYRPYNDSQFSEQIGLLTPKFWELYKVVPIFFMHTGDEKRFTLSYSNAPKIAKAYHIEDKCNDAQKFGSALPSSAVEAQICVTLYCRPINVGTFRFC